MSVRSRIFILSFSLLIAVSIGPCKGMSGDEMTTGSPTAGSNYSFAATFAMFAIGLTLAFSVGACLASVCCKFCRHTDHACSLGSITSSNNFCQTTNPASPNRSAEDFILSVQNHQFEQETATPDNENYGIPVITASDTAPYTNYSDGALVCSNPGGRSSVPGGSVQSMPEEEMLGSNRFAPTTIQFFSQ